MDIFNVDELAGEVPEGDDSTEVLRTDSISVEVMRFEEGDEDQTHAHGEDEVYHVDSGAARIEIEGESERISQGSIIHLEPGTEHRFHGFEDELVMTVFYAPAKGSVEHRSGS